MFTYLRGIIQQVTPEQITLDVQGIGFRLITHPSIAAKLSISQAPVSIYVSLVTRELSLTLYGFEKESEKNLFEALLNVSGIGPKIALSVVATLSIDQLMNILIQKDHPALCKVPGIGKKTAERLLIELKSILPSLATINHLPDSTSMKKPLEQDAIDRPFGWTS